MLNIASQPKLDAVFGLLRMGFEVVGESVNQVSFHGQTFRSSCIRRMSMFLRVVISRLRISSAHSSSSVA
jgi:hypothetical protein